MRIVEILVGLNALLGIGTYLGIKASIRRVKRRAESVFGHEEEQRRLL